MIASSRLNLQCKVANVIKNGEWNWPVNLSNMFDALNVIAPPCITEGKNDKVVWKSYNGGFLDFSVSNVWENIRIHGTLVSWSNLVWFSQCIPRHSFILWLTIQGKLKTQDNMLRGDSNLRLLCTFCGKERNLRLFQNRHRSKEDLCHLIKDMVRLRVLSLRLKPSAQVFVCGLDILEVLLLGVPLISKRLYVKDCHVLIDKARKRILDWKIKPLSFAGRLQLIKSVISSMQVYWASMFILPVSISNDIEKLMGDFLWNFGVFKRGKSLINWNSICKMKVEGGLGIKSLDSWNIALMSKHIRNVITNKESLWVQWVNTYRLKGRSFWDIPEKEGSCWVWKKILKIRGLIKDHNFHKIGDGRNTSLWFDNWHPICPLSNFISKRMIASSGLNLQCKVADVIKNGKNDKVVWKSCNGGFLDFSVSNVWENIRIRGTLVSWSNLVWFSQCIPRHSFILWLAIQGKLKTQDNMLHGDSNLRLLCTFCGKVTDSHDHLFFDCNFPNSIWVLLKNMVRLDNAPSRWCDIVKFMINRPINKSIWSILQRLVLGATVYFIWQERNLRLFQNRHRSKEELCRLIKDMVRLRVLSLRLKPSAQVYEAIDIWSFHVCNDIGSKRVKFAARNNSV
nr:hypothetical protein [Tanacetum cinerariifolium]